MPLEPLADQEADTGFGSSIDPSGGLRASLESPRGSNDLVGQVLGGTYRILERLDEGGMGQLYRAEHVRLHRPIAVKVLANHLAHDPGALARFNREAEIVSQLHHPHIVHILDFDQTCQGEPYIVMELLEGESLARRLDRERMLPIADVVQIVAQIGGALHLAHQKGIVHRDLKPDNVYLVAIEDEQVFVKLLDFGISKSTSAAAKVTREFDVLGTPDYMAPEQAISTAKADHRADQFALASMTYEMLTGRMPFVADSVPELLQKVVNEMPVAPSFYATGLPMAVDEVVLRAMAKQPQGRFSNIQDFAMAFAQAAGVLLHHEPYVSEQPQAQVPPPFMASLPRGRGHVANVTPSGDLSSIAQMLAQSLPIPEAPRPPTFDGATRSIPSAAPRSAFDVATSVIATRPHDVEPRHSGPAPKMPHRAVLRSSTPQARISTPPHRGASMRPPDTAPTTLRSRAPSPISEPPRSYPPGQRPITELELAIADVRRALSFGEQQRAIVQARRAVHVARDCNDRASHHCLVEATSLLEPLLLSLVGDRNCKVSLINPRVSSQGDWTPAHFFLLSQVEQRATVDELLDISPLTRPETLCFIADLNSQGIVRIEP